VYKTKKIYALGLIEFDLLGIPVQWARGVTSSNLPVVEEEAPFQNT
jgi:hypothetical protein